MLKICNKCGNTFESDKITATCKPCLAGCNVTGQPKATKQAKIEVLQDSPISQDSVLQDRGILQDKLCCKCGTQSRIKHQSYCRECYRDYRHNKRLNDIDATRLREREIKRAYRQAVI